MFQINWTEPAESELFETSNYLFEDFSISEINSLTAEIEHILGIIANKPETFRKLEGYENVRYVVILTYNTLYYTIDYDQNSVDIVSFFSNRQSEGKRNL